MIVLGIETAIMNRGSVALLYKNRVVERNYERRDDYRDRLWPAIDMVLKLSGISLDKIEGITVSQGPGSFTGLRVGISVAKTLALSFKKPLLGISTLEVLAQGLDSSFKEKPNLLVPILDAKKKLVYSAVFKKINKGDLNFKLQRETDDLVLTIEEICRMIKEPAIFLGEGIGVYKKIIKKELGALAYFAPERFFFPRASIVVKLGEERLRTKKVENIYALQPIYLRLPEISRSRKRLNYEKRN